MISTYNWQQLNEQEKAQVLLRPQFGSNDKVKRQVKKILQEVKKNQDAAVIKYTKQFHAVELKSLQVTADEIAEAKNNLNDNIHNALQFAMQQITTLHQAQKQSLYRVETSPGVYCERLAKPIEKVGFYIPGGTAPLVSTVLMLAIPAKIAGCHRRILCTPPNKNGEVDPHILGAASLCGIEEIYKCGGAQAIAAMAYGTQSISQVDKIFGPGNAFVTEAKKQVTQDNARVSCDLPAGPSELLIIADDSANARIIAADLLSQAEHSDDAQVLFVTNSAELITNTKKHVMDQLTLLSRQKILNKSLQNARMVLVNDLSQAFAISNQYGPEHLILQIENADNYLDQIFHAGAIFVGQYTAETLGDYVTGSNHVLPTAGYVRNYSGLSINDFMKFISVQTVTKKGFTMLSPYAETFAKMEQLDAHGYAISVRKEELL